MAGNLLMRMADASVNAFKEEIASVKQLADQDQIDAGVEELTSTHALIPVELESQWSNWQKTAETMSSEDRVRRGQIYYQIAGTWMTVTRILEELVKEKVASPTVKARALSGLREAGVRLTAIQNRTWKEWHWFSADDVEEARNSEVKRELFDVEEAFAEDAGVSVPEWRRRVEERKAGGVS